jgi:hypothetical protein
VGSISNGGALSVANNKSAAQEVFVRGRPEPKESGRVYKREEKLITSHFYTFLYSILTTSLLKQGHSIHILCGQ